MLRTQADAPEHERNPGEDPAQRPPASTRRTTSSR